MSDLRHILCFGNPLHGDDGFGPAVSEALRHAALPGHTRVVDCGIRGLDALGWFEDCEEVLLVDAMLGNEPGRLHLLTPTDVPAEFGRGGHGSGVGDLLQAARTLLSPPPRIRILAVEAERMLPFQPGLSAPVHAAVRRAVATIRGDWAGAR